MQKIDASQCKVHVLVCTNEKPAPKSCCQKVSGMEFFMKLKNKLKETGLIATHWATKTGCLGFCNDVGTTVTIYAPGKPARWYYEVTHEDFDFIWNEIVRE